MCIPGDDQHGVLLMRLGLTSLVFTIALMASPAMGQPIEVTTAPDAILCLSRENVAMAHKLAVAKSQAVLSAIGCLRVEAGIRSRLLETVAASGPVRVRFYPAGISAGLVLWALPSSFLAADRTTI